MTPDAQTVRTLITSVTPLAKHLGLTNLAIYRWIKVNRIPVKHIIAVANFYDIEIPIHLTSSEVPNDSSAVLKPKETLQVCLQVQRGRLTYDQAAQSLGVHPRSIQLILTHWGERLPLLYETLTSLNEGKTTLDEAAKTLGVGKYNVHALRRKYGMCPAPKPKPPPKPIVARKATAKATALLCIEGRITLPEAEAQSGLSWRTIHRAIERYSPGISLQTLTHWPLSFRRAYSHEIDKNLPKKVLKLVESAEKEGILLQKWPKYPEKMGEWRTANTKKMLVGVLLGFETLESLAKKRGGDPDQLRRLFTGALRTVPLTYEEVESAHLSYQIALGEYLLAQLRSSEDQTRRGPHVQ